MRTIILLILSLISINSIAQSRHKEYLIITNPNNDTITKIKVGKKMVIKTETNLYKGKLDSAKNETIYIKSEAIKINEIESIKLAKTSNRLIGTGLILITPAMLLTGVIVMADGLWEASFAKMYGGIGITSTSAIPLTIGALLPKKQVFNFNGCNSITIVTGTGD